MWPTGKVSRKYKERKKMSNRYGMITKIHINKATNHYQKHYTKEEESSVVLRRATVLAQTLLTTASLL